MNRILCRDGSADEVVADCGVTWVLVPRHLEWGLDDYFIVRCETTGDRLILCRLERVYRNDWGTMRHHPVKRAEIATWNHLDDA